MAQNMGDLDTGSSPRMRGILGCSNSMSSVTRFIPADAGNTTTPFSTTTPGTVHPRGCGEYRNAGNVPDEETRFIPADAGNTPAARLAY